MRIVSLLPSATEIICALGLSKQLIAVSHACDYPPAVASLPRVTRSIIPKGLRPAEIDAAVSAALAAGRPLYQLDGALLAELAPELIVTQGLCEVCAVSEGTVAALPECVGSARVVSLSGTTVAGIWRDIARVAEAAGVSAAPLLARLTRDWNKLAQTPAPRLKVAVLEWPDPPFIGGHWVPEMVAQVGAVDPLGTPGAPSRRVSWEELAAADPDCLVMAACGFGLADNLAFAEALCDHPQARRLRAVRLGALYAADANSYFSRPAPRLVAGAAQLQRALTGLPASGVLALDRAGQQPADKVTP